MMVTNSEKFMNSITYTNLFNMVVLLLSCWFSFCISFTPQMKSAYPSSECYYDRGLGRHTINDVSACVST